MTTSPIRPTDDTARAQVRDLMQRARFAALGVIDPGSGAPHVSRVAFALDPENRPLTLISTLAFHTGALRENPACSLLVGEPPDKGDALAFARVSLDAKANFLTETDKEYLAPQYLKSHPKAALYIDFADFLFVRFEVCAAALNAGFGKAYLLTGDDIK